jgi:hypothetical protein
MNAHIFDENISKTITAWRGRETANKSHYKRGIC